MLMALMFLIIVKKSRTFSGVPCSANKQVCRSWGGAQPGSQPRLANRNIPCRRCHDQFINGGWSGGRNDPLFSMDLNPFLSRSLNFSMSSIFFREFSEIHKILVFWVPWLLLGNWLWIGHQVVRKLYCIKFVLHKY